MADSESESPSQGRHTAPLMPRRKDHIACKLFGYSRTDMYGYVAMKDSGTQFCLKYLPMKSFFHGGFQQTKDNIWNAIEYTWRKEYANEIKILQENLETRHGREHDPLASRKYIVGLFGEWNSQARDDRRVHPRRDVSSITSIVQFLTERPDSSLPMHSQSPLPTIRATTVTNSALPIEAATSIPVCSHAESTQSPADPPVVNWSLVLVRFVLHDEEVELNARTPMAAICDKNLQSGNSIDPYTIQWTAIEQYLKQTVLRKHLPLECLSIRFEGSADEFQPFKDIGEFYTQILLWSQSSLVKFGINTISLELRKLLPDPEEPDQSTHDTTSAISEVSRPLSEGRSPSRKRRRRQIARWPDYVDSSIVNV